MSFLVPFRRSIAAIVAFAVIGCSPPPPPAAPQPRAIPTRSVGKRALFGFKVAVSDERIAVGAPHAKSNGHRKAGAVLLFDRKSLGFLRKVEAPEPADDALFGFSIDLQGDRLVVGSVGRVVEGAKLAGAAYLFDANTGRLLHEFVESPPREKAEFGSAVALAGGDAIIGSPASEVLGKSRAGIAYRFSGATGELVRSFHLPTPTENLVMGQALAVAADALLLGAPAATVTGVAHAGSVFAFDPNTAKLTRTLHEPEPSSGSTFGAAIDTDGKLAVIGAPNALDRAGAAYVYDLATGAVVHELHEAVHLEDGGMFGYSVALLEDAVAVGAPHTAVKGIPGSGAVYLFDRTTGKPIARLTVQPIGGADLGISVGAGSGSEYVSGAQGGPKGGTVYLSNVPPQTP